MNQLTKVSKKDLIQNFCELVKSERKITAEIVEFIKEIDCRRIYLDLGYASLFAYLTESIGYTAASAQRRIDAARILKEMPEIKTDIQSGKLNLMQLAVVAQSVRSKEKLAPVKVSNEDKREMLSKVANQTLFATQSLVSQFLDLPVVEAEKARPQSDGSIRVELTLTAEEAKAIQRTKELLSAAHQHLSNKDLLMALCTDYLRRKDPIQVEKRICDKVSKRIPSGSRDEAKTQAGPQAAAQGSVQDSDSAQNPTQGSTQGSTPILTSTMEVKPVSPKVRRSILIRDQSCRWIHPATGQRCESRFDLEVDHKQPRWAGGRNSAHNLQALCSAHNRHKYRLNCGIQNQ